MLLRRELVDLVTGDIEAEMGRFDQRKLFLTLVHEDISQEKAARAKGDYLPRLARAQSSAEIA
jgi:hypothetical protein